MESNSATIDDIEWNVKPTNRQHKICTSKTTNCINVHCNSSLYSGKAKGRRKQSNAKKGMAINDSLWNKIYLAHQVILSPSHRFCGQCKDTAINDICKLKFKFKSVSHPSFAPLDSLLSSTDYFGDGRRPRCETAYILGYVKVESENKYLFTKMIDANEPDITGNSDNCAVNDGDIALNQVGRCHRNNGSDFHSDNVMHKRNRRRKRRRNTADIEMDKRDGDTNSSDHEINDGYYTRSRAKKTQRSNRT
eukprot:646033_1